MTLDQRQDTGTSDAATLRELRRVRREIRLGDIEWFDIAYRVYLFALVGTIAVVFASDKIQDLVDDSTTTQQILTRGPSIAGIAAAVAFGIGLRNGADGGPVSIETADVRHLLMAPIGRGSVLRLPIVQRIRSVAFGLALGFGVLAQLVAREIDGSRAAWAASGALFGVLLAILYVATAVVTHALRIPRWLASTVATVGIVWQSAVAWGIWRDDTRGLARIGPANLDGSILFWGIRQRDIDAVALVAAVVLVVLAASLGARLRPEPLERRGQLVSQLRFAATVQDIRTVVLLRRQLRAESVRGRPWFASPDRAGSTQPSSGVHVRPSGRPRRSDEPHGAAFVWRRGLTSLRRLPGGRVVRIVGLAAIAGATASLSVSSSPLFLVAFVAAVFFVGLESLEPLAQEIDHPDLTESAPVDRGWLFLHHLVAPSILLAGAGIIGAAAATVTRPDHSAGAFALAIPIAWAGSIGAIVTTVRDAPAPTVVATTTMMGAERGVENPFSVPEFAGFGNVVTGAMPIVLSAVAALPLYALSVEPSVSTVWRSVLGLTLCLVVVAWWILRRDAWAVRVRAFFAAGRTAAGAAS